MVQMAEVSMALSPQPSVQVTLMSTEAELGSYPKAHICRLQWFAALWPTWGCILSAFGNLQPLWHSWTQALITSGSVRGTWVWTKLPKWRNIFPLVFSRSQLTSLLLLSQSLRDAWRKSAGLSLPSGYRRIFCTTDLSTPRTCRVTATQPRAVPETESNPVAEERQRCFPASCSALHRFWPQDFPMHSKCSLLCHKWTLPTVLLTNTCRGSLPPWRCLLICVWYQ